MPRDRFYRLPSEKRRELFAIATRHFARDGFDRTSLNAILMEAGLSKGSYYYYFDDKDDLFAAVLESAADELLARFPAQHFGGLAPRDFWPSVRSFLSNWTAEFDVSSDVFRAALQLTEAQRRSPRYAPMLAKGHAVYRRLIEAGQALGCVRSDLPLETLVRLLEANDTVLDGIFLQKRAKVTRQNLAKHVELVFDTFERLLLPQPRRVDGKSERPVDGRPHGRRRRG